ncbi:MAG: formylglycine-generating enzyme family protein [Chitinophagaceae bacterium]
MLRGVLPGCTAILILASCNDDAPKISATSPHDSAALCAVPVPSRFAVDSSHTAIHAPDSVSHKKMVWINGGTFTMGSADKEGRADEYPQHTVTVGPFWMDETEVTNDQFQQFVKATGYITTAERKPDWDEIKKQLPEGTPKPPDSVLVPASLVFTPAHHAISLNDASQWWRWQPGASWQHPQGPGSDIKGKGNYPVVQVSWEDAMAYATWAGKRLPTEAEWEFAARAGLINQPFTWGSEPVENGSPKANTWQGHFPDVNTKRDGFTGAAPVRSFPANAFGLYDMAGNVWEWCADWYRPDYYKQTANGVANPTGPSSSFDPDEPNTPKRVVRGGSFLCHDSYCASYRVSARMKTAPDTGLEHTGFRCVSR